MEKNQKIKIEDEIDIVMARQLGREISRNLGFGLVDQTRITTAISELARNILLYAKEGFIIFIVLENKIKKGLEILAVDKGPGIVDLDLALTDGYSTSGGLGAGLSGTKRLMDEFEINSKPGVGTEIKVRKWLLR